jgi:hypothetical protein
LCGPAHVFGAQAYQVETDVDSFLRKAVSVWNEDGEYIDETGIQYAGKSIIEYSELQSEIAGYLTNGVIGLKEVSNPRTKGVPKLLLEDINEYYGLASISLNPDGVFHPLISSTVYRIDLRDQRHEESLFFVLQIEDMYVLTYLYKKKCNKAKQEGTP